MSKYAWLDRRIAAPGPYLALCLSKEDLVKASRDLNQFGLVFPDKGALCSYFVNNKTKELCAIVSLSLSAQTKSAIEIASLLVHEAVHVWQAYVEDIGEKNAGDEIQAYGIQAISQTLLAEYARRIQ